MLNDEDGRAGGREEAVPPTVGLSWPHNPLDPAHLITQFWGWGS
jgi:hypothetical protein